MAGPTIEGFRWELTRFRLNINTARRGDALQLQAARPPKHVALNFVFWPGARFGNGRSGQVNYLFYFPLSLFLDIFLAEQGSHNAAPVH